MLSELFEQLNIAAQDYEQFSSFTKSKTSNYDFVLTDIQMPTTSGFEILQQFKSGDIKNYSNQPIIAMTGSRQHSRQSYLDKGFAEVLQKPFTKDDLLLVLGKVFPNKFSEPTKKTTVTISGEKSELYDLTLLRSFLETEAALQDVLQVFYNETKKDITELKAQIDTENIEGVNQTAHKMLTMCRQIDAKKVVTILETLENISEEEKGKMSSLFEELKKETTNVITELQKNH